jgi:IMP dehydrogenase
LRPQSSLQLLSEFRKEEGLSYDDVLLVPQKSILKSRKDAKLEASLVGDMKIPSPIIASPMTSVVDAKMAKAVFEAGGFSFLPRFNTAEEQRDAFIEATIDAIDQREFVCGGALGMNHAQERIELLYENGCKVFILDIAHAHSQPVMDYISTLMFPEDGYFIVGSIATYEAAWEWMEYGVHGLRVGIGPGAACSTREVTGFGVSQLSAVMEVVAARSDYSQQYPERRLPTIMADGAIKNSGDIVKALVAGADTVMVGRLLAGADEAPHPGEYFGMASNRVNDYNAPEGVSGLVPMEGTVEEIFKKLKWGIKSGISYAGTNSVDDLHHSTQFATIRHGVVLESNTRI